MMNGSLRLALFALMLSFASGNVLAENYLQRADVRAYIESVAEERDLDKNLLAGLFVKLTKQQDILDAISRPAERTLTWKEYRPIFITEKRIVEGIAFTQEYRTLLDRATEVYGVPANVIAAIIGVETFYGRITGKYTVLESLATLAFDYPPRATFFKKELSEFLELSFAEGWASDEVLGSYAGAMGVPQFISSSYRHYAVDFDGDGQRDLFGSMADIVGSVANYLSTHGWLRNAPIAESWLAPAGSREAARKLVTKSLKPSHGATVVRNLGFSTNELARGTEKGRKLSVMTMNGQAGEEFWIAYQNFYVITRYNHSRLYALAVFQLSEALNRAVQ